MRLLLDTHALVWWLTSSRTLSDRVRAVLHAVDDHEIMVSAVTSYEIEFKRARDAVLSSVPERLTSTVAEQGFEWAPVTPADAADAARLPLHHRDPWDRIIIAQAFSREATIVTADRMIAAYGVPVMW
jgi:PIN domain nuclease of toxin-antitoxin system